MIKSLAHRLQDFLVCIFRNFLLTRKDGQLVVVALFGHQNEGLLVFTERNILFLFAMIYLPSGKADWEFA